MNIIVRITHIVMLLTKHSPFTNVWSAFWVYQENLSQMRIPDNTKLYKHPLATVWIREDILHVLSHPGLRTIESIDEYTRLLEQILEGKRIQTLADISDASPMDETTRNYASKHLEDFYQALAIVSCTHIGEVIGKAFINLDSGFPVRMFDNENEAKSWLKRLQKQHSTYWENVV